MCFIIQILFYLPVSQLTTNENFFSEETYSFSYNLYEVFYNL